MSIQQMDLAILTYNGWCAINPNQTKSTLTENQPIMFTFNTSENIQFFLASQNSGSAD